MRPQLQHGLKPSILDRLIDPESSGTAMMQGYSVRQMYTAVLRDLEDLLNVRQTYRDLPEHYAAARDSILMYGLPDLASVESGSAEARAEIGRAIREVIERFEPRLRDLNVSLLNPEEDRTAQSLRFRIDARLSVEPSPDVAFDTILEVASGHYLVTPATYE